MEPSEQQQAVRAVAQRFVEIAPAGWVRLVGNWEATRVDGRVNLNYVTLGVVDLQDRWGVGQFDFDERLYDLVVELHEAMAADGDRWTVLDLEVDADGAFRTSFGYGQPKRSLGIEDEESMGRFQDYLATWVAEHGERPQH